MIEVQDILADLYLEQFLLKQAIEQMDIEGYKYQDEDKQDRVDYLKEELKEVNRMIAENWDFLIKRG